MICLGFALKWKITSLASFQRTFEGYFIENFPLGDSCCGDFVLLSLASYQQLDDKFILTQKTYSSLFVLFSQTVTAVAAATAVAVAVVVVVATAVAVVAVAAAAVAAAVVLCHGSFYCNVRVNKAVAKN